MEKLTKQLTLIVLSSLTALTLGCKKDGESDGNKGQGASTRPTNEELKIGMDQEFENLNPVIKQMAATTWQFAFVGRTLTTMNEKNEWIPMMVEEIPTIENSKAKFVTKDGKKTISSDWRIRDTYTWGDGTPVTGHDVKFSWEVGKHENISAPEREVYTQVAEILVDATDAKKVTMVYDKNRWDYYKLGTFEIIPKHIEEPVFKEHSGQAMAYEKNTKYVTDPTNPGLYNGPYRVAELKLGSHMIFVPNEKWGGAKPKIKKLITKLIPNTATLEANLLSGTIDMISIFGLKMDQGLKFQKTVESDKLPYDVNFKPGFIYEHIDLQLGNPILQDIRVRINREELTKALFEDKQRPAVNNLGPADPWFTEDPAKIVLYPYSAKQAKDLLDQAGWKLEADGYRHKGGKKLSFEFMTTAGNKTRELVQTFLQDQWKQVGVEVIIKNEPARVFFGETVKKSKFDALAMFAWFSSPESTPKSTLHTKNIPSEKNNYMGQNDSRWSNKEVDAILDSLDEDFSHESRVAKIHKVLYHYTNEIPVIPLYYRSDISVTPKNLKGYFETGHQFYSTNFIETWYLE